MKNNSHKIDHALLNAWMDNELDSDEHAMFDDHLKECPACQKEAMSYGQISSLITKNIEQAAENTNFGPMEQRLFDALEKRNKPWWIRLACFMGTGRVLIPAGTLAAVLLVFFFSMQPAARIPGPSALISSLSGDYASVMIMETPNEQQTIIWIQETALIDNKDKG